MNRASNLVSLKLLGGDFRPRPRVFAAVREGCKNRRNASSFLLNVAIVGLVRISNGMLFQVSTLE